MAMLLLRHRHVCSRSRPGGRRQDIRRISARAMQQQQPHAHLKAELDAALGRLPGLEGVLPGAGRPEDRSRVVSLVEELERAAPYHPNAPGADALLLGEWDLVFASNGTVVTRTPIAQAVASLSTLSVPGVGIGDIRQELSSGGGGGSGGGGSSSVGASAVEAGGSPGTSCSNCVSIGLGPFGTWDVRVTGHWLTTHQTPWRFSGGDWGQRAAGGSNSFSSSGSGTSSNSSSTMSDSEDAPGLASEVAFDGFGVRLRGFLGLDLGSAMPELKLAAPRRPAQATRPNWRTTYCDGSVRVGRGESGGVFVFKRKKPSSV